MPALVTIIDDVSGDEISGPTITNTDTAQTLASSCGGVSLGIVGPTNLLQTNATNGINCTTAARVAYLAAAPTAIGAPSGSLHPARDTTWWQDGMNGIAGTQWQTHDPQKGPRVGLASGSPSALDGSGRVYPLGAGTGLYVTLAAPLDNTYELDTSFQANANTDNELDLYVVYQDANNNFRIRYTEATTTWDVIERAAGIDTILATDVHDLVTDGFSGQTFTITVAAAAVTVLSGIAGINGAYVTAAATPSPHAFFFDANGAGASGFRFARSIF